MSIDSSFAMRSITYARRVTTNVTERTEHLLHALHEAGGVRARMFARSFRVPLDIGTRKIFNFSRERERDIARIAGVTIILPLHFPRSRHSRAGPTVVVAVDSSRVVKSWANRWINGTRNDRPGPDGRNFTTYR